MGKELVKKKASDYLDDAVMEKRASRAFTRVLSRSPEKIEDYITEKKKYFNIDDIKGMLEKEKKIIKQISDGSISPSKGKTIAGGVFRKMSEKTFFDAMTRDNKKRDLNKIRDLAAYKKRIFDYEEFPLIARNPNLKKTYDFTASKKEFRSIPPVSKSIKRYLEISKVPEIKQTHKHKTK